MNSEILDVLIIGSGPAGYSAAIYAARAGHNPLIITGAAPGGQLMMTSEIENYPGFSEMISGPDLMDKMYKHAENVGTKIEIDTVVNVTLDAYPFVITCESGNVFLSKSMIIATGASAKWLGIESETKYRGRGVSACATCDGSFFRNKKVCVIGGGNTAVEEAIYLSNIANEVTVIHRGNSFKAEKIMQERLFDKKNIGIAWNSETIEILGNEKRVIGITIKNRLDETVHKIDADGIFIAIGYVPNTTMFKNQIDIDEYGYIKTQPWSTQTSVKGVFAAGDVRDNVYRQAITSAGQGCMAAIEMDRYLSLLA